MATAKNHAYFDYQKRVKALRLRESGMKFKDIGGILEVSTARARQLYLSGLRRCCPHNLPAAYGNLDEYEIRKLRPIYKYLKEMFK